MLQPANTKGIYDTIITQWSSPLLPVIRFHCFPFGRRVFSNHGQLIILFTDQASKYSMKCLGQTMDFFQIPPVFNRRTHVLWKRRECCTVPKGIKSTFMTATADQWHQVPWDGDERPVGWLIKTWEHLCNNCMCEWKSLFHHKTSATSSPSLMWKSFTLIQLIRSSEGERHTVLNVSTRHIEVTWHAILHVNTVVSNCLQEWATSSFRYDAHTTQSAVSQTPPLVLCWWHPPTSRFKNNNNNNNNNNANDFKVNRSIWVTLSPGVTQERN